MDRITELRQRAETLIASITDNTSASRAAEIENEHRGAIDEIAQLESLRDFCRSNGVDYMPIATMPIAEGKRAILDTMIERSERSPIFSHVAMPSEGTNRAAEDFIYSRMTGRRPQGQATKYAGMSLTEFGRSWLSER